MVDNPITEGQRIAALNDRLRTRIGCLDALTHWKAQVWMTAGIAALPPAWQLAIQERVRTYDDFSEDNDPYGEHDFGAFDMPLSAKSSGRSITTPQICDGAVKTLPTLSRRSEYSRSCWRANIDQTMAAQVSSLESLSTSEGMASFLARRSAHQAS